MTRIGRHKRVVTRDGVALGTVKDTEDEYFKIDVPRGFDYWLPLSCVEDASGGEIRVDFPEASLADRKILSLDTERTINENRPFKGEPPE